MCAPASIPARKSGSNRTLRTIKKGFEIEPAYRVAVESVKHFPSVHCSFMWGFPFETAEDVEETPFNPSDVPSGDTIAREFQRFLRQRGQDG